MREYLRDKIIIKLFSNFKMKVWEEKELKQMKEPRISLKFVYLDGVNVHIYWNEGKRTSFERY